jgi:predicted AlkP superfamily pyrophosphatase or phosphodiesterase
MLMRRRYVVVLALLILLAACARPWAIEVSWDGEPIGAITPERWRAWAEAFPEELRDNRDLPLERALWEMGITSIESVTIGETSRPWAEVADDAWLRNNGRIELNGAVQQAAVLALTSPPEAALVTAHVTDVAPTICRALGVGAPASSTGTALDTLSAERAVFIFLDGLGYRRYQVGRPRSLMPYLDSLGQPHLALTVYPSVTRVVSAAFLTGAPPAVNGVRSRDMRDTASETVFDVLAANGMTGVAVEGESIPFNLRNAEVILSGDRDGNGHTDDNTFANAMNVVMERMPDFLWVHFHGIDDMGHTYGPDAVEVDIKMAEVDGYVRDLIAALPEDTLVVIASDHGMHAVDEEGRLGNHGTLQPDDILVPIWVVMR